MGIMRIMRTLLMLGIVCKQPLLSLNRNVPITPVKKKRSCPLLPKPTNGRTRYICLGSAEDTSPAEAGAWGWVRLGIACEAGRCREGE